MYGINLTDRIMGKWGDAGQAKVNEWKEKQSARMTGTGNVSYGIIRENSGRSYKGWYKGLFFRSSYELAFIIDYEDANKTLPESAENRIRIDLSNNKTYTPDFFCPTTNTVFEIKAERFLEDNQEKFAAGEQFCADKSWSYKVLTETDLRSLPIECQRTGWIQHLIDERLVELTDYSAIKLEQRTTKNPA